MNAAIFHVVLLTMVPSLAVLAADPKASHREWQTYHGDYGRGRPSLAAC